MQEAHIRIDRRKIQILLIERGLRACELARAWGVSRAAVSRAINGKRPTSMLLGKLAAILGVPLKELLSNGDESKRRRAA